MLAFARYPGARAYFMAATVSRMSRDMFETAVVLFVLAKTDNPAVAGSMVAASLIPSAILGPMLGVWMDRSAHRRLILGANQVLLGISLAAILFSAGRLPDPALILFAVLAGATGPLHTGGFTSLLSVLFPRQWLPQANAAETTSFNASGIAAPALAALIIAVGNVDLAVTAQAFIAIAAMGGSASCRPSRRTRTAATARETSSRPSLAGCATSCASRGSGRHRW
ncbi:MAG: MFS transporter [Dehalococcoidia bacterium]|nr:MFS transporter [Dehalococcoidia bacterium]